MATYEDLVTAFKAADEAGNVEDARAFAQAIQSYGYAPSAPKEKRKKVLVQALKSGVESFVSPTQTGLEALFGSPEEAAKRGLERQKLDTYEGPSLERLKKVYQEKGLFPAAKELVSEIPEAITGQLPQLGAIGVGATLGGIAGGTLGSALPGAGTTLGAVAGAKFGSMIGQALVEFPQFFGSNIERQAVEQIKAGKPVDINRVNAAIGATGQTASDIFETQILFGASKIGQLLGVSPKNLANKSAEEVEKLAKESLLKTIAKGTARGAAAEIPNEIFQQMVERAQAGLSITSPDALNEYGSTAYQVGLLAPLGMVGSFSERAAARREAKGLETPPVEEPKTPIIQEKATPDQPVTQAGLAPIETVPEVPAGFEAPRGIPTPPPQTAIPEEPPQAVIQEQPPAQIEPPQATPTGVSGVLSNVQNRDRSSPVSVAQMQKIAANPMYQFVGPSNTISGNGAPIITGPKPAYLGAKGEAVSEDGTRIPFQYAVVEAKDVLPSHNADGSVNKEYGAEHTGLKAIVGNGRTAGLQEAYRKGAARNYVEAIKNDNLHGIDPKIVEGMKEPVLVRYALPEAIPSNIGDISNTSGTLNLSTLEQAKNDAGRFDLGGLNFNDNGDINPNSIRQFIASMPTSEQANLIDKNGQPTRQAEDRLNAAIFHKAYGNDELTVLAHQTADPEARNILKALSEAAPQISQIQPGDYDIRPYIAQAAQLAINARRNNISLQDVVNQQDITSHPISNKLLQLFADNPRSPKKIATTLKDIATNINDEVTKPKEGLFGAEPTRSLEDIIADAFGKTEPKEFKIPKTPQQIRKEIDGFGIAQLAKWAEDNAPNEPARIIANKVNKIIQQLEKRKALGPLNIMDNVAGMETSGNRGEVSTPEAGTVIYEMKLTGLKNGKPVYSTGLNYTTILHELLHVATNSELRVLKDSSPIYKELYSVLNKVRNQVRKDQASGQALHPALDGLPPKEKGWQAKGYKNTLKNPRELVSWALTSQDFQDYLSKIKVGEKSLLDNLITVIRKLLGINPDYETALDAVFRHASTILDKDVAETTQQIKDIGRKLGTKDAMQVGKEAVDSENIAQTQTPEFKRWFGNSKVVNEDGSPKVLYHATAKDFKKFIPGGVKQEGRNLESGEAIWLSPNKEYQPAMHNISGKEGKFREGTNVMPVYVSAKEPLLLDDDISLNWARDVFANGSMEFPHLMAKKWINAVKKSGYDSIIYDDPNKTGDVNNIEYLVFEPNQIKSAIGNRGTFSLTSDSIDEETVANNLVKSTKPIGKGRETINAAKEVFNAVQTETFWTKFRINWIDSTSGVGKTVSEMPIFQNGDLRADMLLRTQGQLTNIIRNGIQSGTPDIASDGTFKINPSENNLARSQIIADTINGKIVYDGEAQSGRLGIATVARIMRAKDIMAEDKARRELGRKQLAYAKQLTQELREARDRGAPVAELRGILQSIKQLRQNGYKNAKTRRELQVKPADIQWAEEQIKNIPEVRQVLDIWKEVNDSLVTLWENSGLLTKEQADNYRAKENYVPLFKSRDDLEGRDGTYGGKGGAKTTKEMKQLRGSYATRNIWENVEKHYASMVAAAYQNHTRKVATAQLVSLGAAEITNKNNKDVNLRYRDPTNPEADTSGIVHVILSNPNDVVAFQMMHYELGPIMKAFSASTKVLRATALVNPKYWLMQLIRDPIHASLVNDSGIVTPFHSIKEYMNILRNASPEAKILASRGVIGQVDSTIDIHDFLKQAGREKTTPTQLDKMLHKVMQMHEASDAATRVAIYKKEYAKAIKDGMSADMATNYAVHKARESINFGVRGMSPTLNALRHMVPFLSASITSLDTVYRAMFGQNLPEKERQQALKTFYTRAMVMMGMTVAYAMMYQDDDEYKKLPDLTKDRNWLIPNPMEDGPPFIRLPVPFEIGFLLKTIPEASVRYFNNTSTGKEVLASYAVGLANNLPGGSVPPISLFPQAVKPLGEVIANYSIYTGRPIEGIGDQGKPVEYRGGERASEVAKILSSLGLKEIGLSPAKIDYLIQGYFAELGIFTTGTMTWATHLAEGKAAPASNLEQIPGLRSFMTDRNTSKAVADFYELEHNAQQVTNYFNELKNTGKGKEAKEYISDEQTKAQLAASPSLRRIGNTMTQLHKQINFYKDRQDMDPEERRIKINQLEQQLHNVASQGYKIAEKAGIIPVIHERLFILCYKEITLLEFNFMKQPISDAEFIKTWNELRSATKVANKLKLTVRSVHIRRRNLEKKLRINLESDSPFPQASKNRGELTAGNTRRELKIDDGMVVVFSDAHFWPDEPSVSYLCLLKFLEIHRQKIKAVVNNGDAFDGASISRFPAHNFDKLPTVKEEIDACVEALTEIENKVNKSAALIWCMGNHDQRYESLIVNNAPQLSGMKGTSLKDWFPLWKPCYSLWINTDTVIKHRFKNGAMAGRNNAIHGGVNFVSGHTHVGAVQPFSDYNGTRYGVQTGTLANIYGRQFDYAEDNPKDWMECFAVLTFKDGKLLMPELVKPWDNRSYEFRGEVVRI